MLKARNQSLVQNRSRYDPQLLSYVILLRFGTAVNPDFTKPSWTINRLQSWSRNQSLRWSKLSNFAFVHTIIPLKLVPRIDRNTHSNTLGTWSLHPRYKNPLIYHWLRERNCFTGDLVKRKYRHPPSVAFIWSTKSGSKTSSEARER